MSYQVLARKWRPQQFGDMIGQEHVLKALVNALESNRLHHAYLFTGMRGVGKTTIARIFAKCLNCERVETVTANPCGECATCQDIEAGRFFDLIEVDAASRTKVDETRELLENVPYAPTSGRYKVYLIDEVHMFSNHSFNALLKTLEEPPEHVKFLLATTDPQKVPVTVLSRCLQFNLKRMVPARLADYLEKILGEESISNERGALDLIARAADGSVRDSLSLVEQAAAYGEGSVKLSEVESMLGRVSVARLLELINSLADHNIDQLFSRINELAQYAPDYHELLGEILSLTHRVALLQSVPNSVEPDATELEQLQALADKVSAEDIQLWYQIGMHARRDMPFAPDPREAFDMAMLRMLAFSPQGGNGGSGGQGVPAPVANSPAGGASAAGASGVGGGASSGVTNAAGVGTGASSAVTGSAVSAATTASASAAAAAAVQAAASPAKIAVNQSAVEPAKSSSPPPASTQASAQAPTPASAPVEASAATAASHDPTALSSSEDRMAALNAALGRAPATKKKLNDAPVDNSNAEQSKASQAVAQQKSSPSSQPNALNEVTTQTSNAAPAEAQSETVKTPTGDHPEAIKPLTVEASQEPSPVEPAEKLALHNEHWPNIVRVMGVEGLPLQLAMNSAIQNEDNGVLTLLLPKPAQHLNKPQVVEQLTAAVSHYNEASVKIQVSLKEAAARKAQQDAENSIENDPLLAELLNRVDGEVTKNSVRPIQTRVETTANNGENS